MKCAGCSKVTKENNSIRCAGLSCEKIFCSLCINISSFSADRKKSWKCPDCAAQKKGGDNSLTPVRGGLDSENVTTRKKTSESSAECSSDEIKRLTEQLCKVTTRLEEVTQSLNYFHERMEELVTTIKANDSRMKYLEKRDQEFTIFKSTIAQLQSEVNVQAQYGLVNEIELVGIPESPAENLQHTVQLAARKLGVDLEDKDVDWITRVGPRRPAVPSSLPEGGSKLPRPIVVRFLRKSKRDQILKASKSRRNISSADLDAPGAPQRVFFNERLTRENRILFRDARNRSKKEGYAFCWCNRGAIYVRQREGKAAVLLRGQADLDRLFVNTSHVGDDIGS